MKNKKKCLKLIIFIISFLVVVLSLLFILGNNDNINLSENNNVSIKNEKTNEIKNVDSSIKVEEEKQDNQNIENINTIEEEILSDDLNSNLKESSTNNQIKEENKNTNIQENTSSNNKVEDKTNNNVISNNTTNDDNMTEETEDTSKEDNNVNTEEQESTNTTEEKEETNTNTEVIDEEYERLMSLVEYETYEECMADGFAIHEQDTVNIYGFSCPYIAYKGKAIGYRLKLEYSNPMEQWLF